MKLSLLVATPEVRGGPLALLSGSFEERLTKAAALGYDGVELMCRNPALIDAHAIRRSLAASGLEAPAIVTGEVFGEDKLCLVSPDAEVGCAALQRLCALVDLAAIWGAVVNVGRVRGRLDWLPAGSDGRALMIAALRELADYARPRGVRITLEAVNRYEVDSLHGARDTVAFLEQVQRENVGLMLDTFHMNIEDASIEESVRLAQPYLWHVHVADSNRLSPGQGHFDFGGFFAVLSEINYRGWVSVEQLARPDPDTAARWSIEYLRRYDNRLS